MGVSLLPSLIATFGGRDAEMLNGGRKGQELVVICSASPSAKLLLLLERNENRQGPAPHPPPRGGPWWGAERMGEKERRGGGVRQEPVKVSGGGRESSDLKVTLGQRSPSGSVQLHLVAQVCLGNHQKSHLERVRREKTLFP